MGRPFTEPSVHARRDIAGHVVAWCIAREEHPDDEFHESQILCDTGWDQVKLDGSTVHHLDIGWVSVGSSYGGNAIEFPTAHQAELFLAGIVFGRESVTIRREF